MFQTISFRVILELKYKFLNSSKNQIMEKKIHLVETNNKKMKTKNFKFKKILERFFFNRSKIIFKNQKITKKFITK